MVLAIIFLVLFLGLTGFSIFRSVSLIKTPMVNVDFKKFFLSQLIFVGGASIAFLVASFGFYMWLGKTPDAIHVVQLVIGGLLLSFCLVAAINCFIVHYYGRNIPEGFDKFLFISLIAGFTLAEVMLFVYTNGLAPYLTYPLVNGINFQVGFVTPAPDTPSPNIAFYALCILSGALLVYFLCDHYMYKEYGKHGILESTFYVAFPAGILGARIWYVVGNWAKEFNYGKAMVDFNGVQIWAPLAIWEGGLTILGGAVMGIVVGVWWYLWRNKGKSIWIAVDVIVPTILIAQAVGRWGNFFNCEVHGLAVDGANWKWLPEIVYRNAQFSSTGMDLRGTDQIYVPLFFIESFTNILGYFVIAHVFGKALRKYTELGDLCFGYIVWYGLTRVLMEPLRSADYQMGEDGYWSWVWSMIFVLAGTLLIVINHLVRYLLRKKKNEQGGIVMTLRSSIIFLIIVAVLTIAFISVGSYLMASHSFAPVVTYNPFNIGLMLVIFGSSICLLLTTAILSFFNRIQ